MASNASQFQDVKLGKIPLAKDEVTPEEEQIQDALKHLDLLRARVRSSTCSSSLL